MIPYFLGKQNVGLKELKESNTETESETNLSDLETETETESTYSAGYSAGYKRGLAEVRDRTGYHGITMERTGYHGITMEASALQNIRSGDDNHYKNQFMKQLFEK